MMTDPISDLLARIRNAQMVGKETMDVPASRAKVRICEILKEEGYVEGYKVFSTEKGHRQIRLTLKYQANNQPVIESMTRISKPGRREYVGKDEIPRVNHGLGIAILSTNKGVISSREARKLGVGGEVICTVF
ncbi:30S ribosomal protein S8 [Magnetococcales bacterium HHB-1]